MPVDVVEKPKEFQIIADIPQGVPRENLKVRVTDDGVLTITAENTQQAEKEEGQYHRSERSWSCVSRALKLPPNVDAAKVQARFEKGALKVAVPKLEPKQPEKKGSDVPIS